MPVFTKLNTIKIKTPGEDGIETYTFPSEGHFLNRVIERSNSIIVIEVDKDGVEKPQMFRNYHIVETS